MDSADTKSLKSALSVQGTMIHHHEEQLRSVSLGVRELGDRQVEFQSAVTTQVHQLSDQLHQVLARLDSPAAAAPPVATTPVTTTPPPPVPAPVLRLAAPDKFSGDTGNCRAFLVQCDLHFTHNPAQFPSDQAKVAFIVSHLTGRAAAWATAEWSRGSILCRDLDVFRQAFSAIFDQTTSAREASRALLQLRQGSRLVTDYAIDFRTLATDSGWNQPALIDAFMCGLADPIKDHLSPFELPSDLETLVAMATRVDKRLRERPQPANHPPSRQGRARDSYPARQPLPSPLQRLERTAPSQPSEEPMQLGRAKLTPAERQRRLKDGSCFYCGKQGHRLSGCPVKDRAHQ